MAKKGLKSYSVRIDEQLLHKLHVVSVEAYEAKHGRIELGEKKEP